jgi:transcriptional regulator with XRE-family HTH domain
MPEITIEDRIRKLGICQKPVGVKPPLGGDLAFPDRLRTVQEKLGLRRDKQFADLIGVSRATMSAYLNGNQYPREQVLRRIAAEGGVALNWLRGDRLMECEQDSPVVPENATDIDALADAIVRAIVRRLSL